MTAKRFAAIVLACGIVLAALAALAPAARAQAAFPFSDGFESGSLGPEWTDNSDPNGQTQVTTSYKPHEGAYHVAMDAVNSGTYGLNQLDLTIDLSAQTDVELTYWYKEFGDEDHPEDGCFISDDGVNFHLVQSHNGGPEVWTAFTVDIDAEAAILGLGLNSAFVIRFSQYDNSSLTSDGICIDDVTVDVSAAESLACSVADFSAAMGGVAYFALNAGPQYGGREYLLLGSGTGTSPGIILQGGGILPLNPGFFFEFVRTHVNTSAFVHFSGTLTAAGEAYAKMDTFGPINPLAAGKHFDFAYTLVNPYDFQSKTVGIDVLP